MFVIDQKIIFKQTAESESNSSKNASKKGSFLKGEKIKSAIDERSFALNKYTRDRLLVRLAVQNIDDGYDRAMTQVRVSDFDEDLTIDIRRFMLPLSVECLHDYENDSGTSSIDTKERNTIVAPLFFNWFFRIAEKIGGSEEHQILSEER